AYTQDKYNEFKQDFWLAAKGHKPSERLKGPLKVNLDFILVPANSVKQKKRPFPSVRPDLDNYVKAVLDSMMDFWVDDAQVCEIHTRKLYSWVDKKAAIRVRVEELLPNLNFNF